MFVPKIDDHDVNRRTFLRRTGMGFGPAALAMLMGLPAGSITQRRSANHGLRDGNFCNSFGKAKRIIHLCMAGGPSQFETFDYKPRLAEIHGQPFPDSYTAGQQLAQLQNTTLNAMGPQFAFARHGESGQEVSELFPHLAKLADDLCIIRSLHTEQINHDPAHAFFNSGSIIKGRPSMGSWLLYGLGSESENLPGFVVMTSTSKCGGAQPISARQWSSGFLPSRYQGVEFQSTGDLVHYIGNPQGVCQSAQRQLIDEINRLNGMSPIVDHDAELATRISQYEMAFRMQTSVPELSDFSQETPETLKLYGIERPGDGSFASNCLMARRLAERGVRMIQLYHRAWDHHDNLKSNMKVASLDVDQACAALLEDLKRRGLLQDTLVVCCGEFGRTPMAQGSGRDHHILSFSGWIAGGGIRAGITFGETDELGYRAVVDPVSVHDLHATLLHLFGIDHLQLTFRYQGRDFRLTDVFGEVVDGIIA
ncbi:MAG TPA: DUF1501 domain-containing protein [Pirellulaceae bacterium]|nr:DUF1501 domain-containing protein [Pirellulaceae bacterium]HMO93466.1 DUF1501 domain-containing protein [Pirellulaceae bacterium]HMP69219.1 DUF1501 domain-containing protein [Pirellulaceae bacterium]